MRSVPLIHERLLMKRRWARPRERRRKEGFVLSVKLLCSEKGILFPDCLALFTSLIGCGQSWPLLSGRAAKIMVRVQANSLNNYWAWCRQLLCTTKSNFTCSNKYLGDNTFRQSSHLARIQQAQTLSSCCVGVVPTPSLLQITNLGLTPEGRGSITNESRV